MKVKSEVLEQKHESEHIRLFQTHYNKIVEADNTPYLYIDTSSPIVSVPSQYIENGKIIIDISPSAISDFKWHKDKIQFKTSFSHDYIPIVIPFDSMIALYSKEAKNGVMFKEIE
jgi:stringent starvation protein B